MSYVMSDIPEITNLEIYMGLLLANRAEKREEQASMNFLIIGQTDSVL